MTNKGSVKETGEEISDKKWQRFEAAVGVDKDGRSAVHTDQPFRDEVEHPGTGGDKPRPDDAGDPERRRDAAKTTTRTE